MLEESKVLTFIQRWAQTKALPQPTEMDGYSSENTSRAQTPLNTPDGSSSKLGPECDRDTSKPAVDRRLKIISENSLDSALSDASKASDGKEEEEEEDDEEEDESAQSVLPDDKQHKAETVNDASDPVRDSPEEEVKDTKVQKQEETERASDGGEQIHVEDVKEQIELEVKVDINVKLEKELEVSDKPSGEELTIQAPIEMPIVEGDQPTVEIQDSEIESVQINIPQALTEQPVEQVVAKTETPEAENPPIGSEAQPDTPAPVAPPSSETPEVSLPTEDTPAPADTPAIETPSQDEEEGVSDVESERSQEPQVSALDISSMAARLLESWKDLKVSSQFN